MALAARTLSRLPVVGLPLRSGWVALLVATGLAAVLAGLIAALAGTFQRAVRQGEAARRATAAQVEADWRCRALRGRGQRDRCLAWVHADPPADMDDLLDLEQQVERARGTEREPARPAMLSARR